ncbi:MAG: hypothetical protein QGG67_20680 [Gammaproteobacteria bacterium]|mgnify:CR=1 FL=1|jgi:hypothetical protein|nr:hypothetical protein [Gammaproteobacteria bacterium]|tara:strand:- start:9611 stop:10276 length:666 start_codon:yes stop_codon:yes gene_type:complete
MGPGSLLWKFATRNPGTPIFEYAGNGATVEIPVNVTEFNFYIPPEDGFPTIGGFSTSFSGGLSIDTQFVDDNTLGINLNGSIGQMANFFLNGRTFSLVIGEPATLPPDPILDLSVGAAADEVAASLDLTTQILTIPLLVVDDGDRVGLKLRLLDATANTFIFDSLIAANEAVTAASTFSSASLLLDIPRVDVGEAQYSLQLQLIDAAEIILQLSAVQEITP